MRIPFFENEAINFINGKPSYNGYKSGNANVGQIMRTHGYA
jgi:hypothetical protein